MKSINLGQILNLRPEIILGEDNVPIHRYFHTNWNFRTPPFTKIPVYLESYNPKTKTFSVQVLTDKKHFDLGLDYPLVPITEDQAQEIVNQRTKGKGVILTKNAAVPTPTPIPIPLDKNEDEKPDTSIVVYPKPVSMTNETATPIVESKPVVIAKKKKEKKHDDRVSMSTLILVGIEAEKTINEIVEEVSAIYPERDPKKIRSLISCHRSRVKWHREHPDGK